MSKNLVDRLVAATSADRQVAGVVVEGVYQPAGGAGERLAPPTFPVSKDGDSPYATFERTVDGSVEVVVVVDQVQSMANRVEEALSLARRDGRVKLPVFRLRYDSPKGSQELTSLEFPHRYADAYLRDSLHDGVRFDKSEPGIALRAASMQDACALFEREPYSILYGAWDSHRKGIQAKFPRVYSSEMWGLDWAPAVRRAGRYDPLNLNGQVDGSGGSDWSFLVPAEDKKKTKGNRLSEIGHGHIAPNSQPGGGTVSSVRRRGWISLAGLERVRFGDSSAEAVGLARATLVALALVGDRLAFGGPSVWLRSGCDLVKESEQIRFNIPGGEDEIVSVTASEAIAAFNELRQLSAAAGLVMADDVIDVEPITGLADAIAFTMSRSDNTDQD